MARTITLVCEVSDKYPQWIMDEHLNPTKPEEFKIIAISEGNVVEELENEHYEYMDLQERMEE